MNSSAKILIGLALLLGAFLIGKPLYMQPDYDDGEVAPNFTGTNLQGLSFDLQDLKGQYVLVEFWGSWCGPCIREIPDLRGLYRTFNGKEYKHARNFEIVSIAVEQSQKRWPKAVEKYDLDWPYHTLDLATDLRFFDSPIANAYGVKEVPTSFFLNPEGKILGVNWKATQISEYLSEDLK